MMKKTFFLSLLCAVSLLCSCSSELEDKVQPEEKDFVEVGFNMCGDFLDVSNKPMTKAGGQNTYYYFKITKPGEIGNPHIHCCGQYGFFDDLSKARVKLERGVEYNIDVTAFVEYDGKIDVDSFSKIEYKEFPDDTKLDSLNIFNKFSDYLVGNYQIGPIIKMPAELPMYIDENIDRYHSATNVTVYSNQTVDIELQRASYALRLEIDAPILGSISVSCSQPSFHYMVLADEGHFSSGSKIYSMGNVSCKKIAVTMDFFDGGDGSSNKTITQKITVKKGVETTIRVNYDAYDAENQFNIILDKTPMVKEEVNF